MLEEDAFGSKLDTPVIIWHLCCVLKMAEENKLFSKQARELLARHVFLCSSSVVAHVYNCPDLAYPPRFWMPRESSFWNYNVYHVFWVFKICLPTWCTLFLSTVGNRLWCNSIDFCIVRNYVIFLPCLVPIVSAFDVICSYLALRCKGMHHLEIALDSQEIKH